MIPILALILNFLQLIRTFRLIILFWFVDIYLLLIKFVGLRLLRTCSLWWILSFIWISYYLIHYEVHIPKCNNICHDLTIGIAHLCIKRTLFLFILWISFWLRFLNKYRIFFLSLKVSLNEILILLGKILIKVDLRLLFYLWFLLFYFAFYIITPCFYFHWTFQLIRSDFSMINNQSRFRFPFFSKLSFSSSRTSWFIYPFDLSETIIHSSMT